MIKMAEKKLQKKFCKFKNSFYLCTRKSEATDRRDFRGSEKNKRSLKIK